jgi:hypothetical protein
MYGSWLAAPPCMITTAGYGGSYDWRPAGRSRQDASHGRNRRPGKLLPSSFEKLTSSKRKRFPCQSSGSRNGSIPLMLRDWLSGWRRAAW